MTSPTKKRKPNPEPKKGPSKPSRGIDYFFSRQRQNVASNPRASPVAPAPVASAVSVDVAGPTTDEELAREVQAQWDAEVRGERGRASTEDASSVGLRSPTSSTAADTAADTAAVTKTAATATALSLQCVSSANDDFTNSIPLDESPLAFRPSVYLPQLRRQWAAEGGGSASYALLTRCFVLVNATQSRIKIVDTLVNCVRLLVEGDPDSLLPAVWLATNAISPPYVSLELGLGGSAIGKALKQVCGLTSQALKAMYDKHGDAGDVAFEAKKKKKQSFTLRRSRPLTIRGVYDSLVRIARSQGQGSVETKQRIVERLLQDARGGEESRYVVRTLCQHLRIGAVKTTMLIALSRALLLSRPPSALPDPPRQDPSLLAALKKEELTELYRRAEEIVKACFARRPNYNDLVPALLTLGVAEDLLRACDLTLHIPLRPMLGGITRDLAEMLERLRGRAFACEWKYDGQRAQVHRDANGKVSIFSRHLELMTDKYPDLVALMSRICGGGVESFVLEGEVVAVEKGTGALKNFQTLTGRARKDVEIGSVRIDVCLFAFDLMYLNGTPLLDRPFRERRELLRTEFVEIPDRFTWVRSLDATSSESEPVLDFFKLAAENRCEGIMVKILDNLATDMSCPPETEALGMDALERKLAAKGEDKKPKCRRKPLLATYEPDKRLDSWLKVKKDYTSSSETLDLVPVAAWHGQGRKAKWWSPILLAARNEAAGALEGVCKCMSGFTDAFYKENRAFYDEGDSEGESDEDDGTDDYEGIKDAADRQSTGQRRNVRKQQPAFIRYSGPRPDIWFEPQEVWEIAFADITLSPTYVAAREVLGGDRGLSLRFPRFVRKRTDKAIEDASTDEFLGKLWEKQETRGSAAAGAAAEAGQEEDDIVIDEEEDQNQ